MSSSSSSSRRCCSRPLAYRSSSRSCRSLLPCLRHGSSHPSSHARSAAPRFPATPTRSPAAPSVLILRPMATSPPASPAPPSSAPLKRPLTRTTTSPSASTVPSFFCLRCSDQLHDPDFDSSVLLSLSPTNANANAKVAATAFRKRRRVNYLSWTPDPCRDVNNL